MEEATPKSCKLLANIQLQVPVYPKKLQGDNNHTSGQNFQPNHHPRIVSISLPNFSRNQFKYDATWFTEQFHSLEALWRKQSTLVSNRIYQILRKTFSESIDIYELEDWTNEKFNSFEQQINSVTTTTTTTTTPIPPMNNSSFISIEDEEPTYNIDSGLL